MTNTQKYVVMWLAFLWAPLLSLGVVGEFSWGLLEFPGISMAGSSLLFWVMCGLHALRKGEAGKSNNVSLYLGYAGIAGTVYYFTFMFLAYHRTVALVGLFFFFQPCWAIPATVILYTVGWVIEISINAEEDSVKHSSNAAVPEVEPVANKRLVDVRSKRALFVWLLILAGFIGLCVVWYAAEQSARTKQAVDEKDIHTLCESGLAEEVEQLLDSGVPVDSRKTDYTGNEWTPLHTACHDGKAAIAMLLIDKGANINATSIPRGRTPLHIALYAYNFQLAQALVERGAKLNIGDCDGRTPLHYAVRYSSPNMVRVLLENGADVNSVARHGNATPLHDAIIYGDRDMIKLLLENGASLDVRTDTDRAPLGLAIEQNKVEAVEFLLYCGSDVDETDQYGVTPLMQATYNGQYDIVKLLLENGADTRIKDKLGYTAETIAEQEGHKRIVALLREFEQKGNQYKGH